MLFAACGGVWFMLIHDTPTRSGIELSRGTLDLMLRREPRGFPMLTWIFGATGYLFPADARDAAVSVAHDYQGHSLVRATVIEPAGFSGSIVRSIVAGVDLVSRPTRPSRTFTDLPQALKWCTEARVGERRPSFESVLSALERGVLPLRQTRSR
jgi:hypothetical protein